MKARKNPRSKNLLRGRELEMESHVLRGRVCRGILAAGGVGGRSVCLGRIRLLCPAGREERVEGAAAMGVGGLLSAETLRAVGKEPWSKTALNV